MCKCVYPHINVSPTVDIEAIHIETFRNISIGYTCVQKIIQLPYALALRKMAENASNGYKHDVEYLLYHISK